MFTCARTHCVSLYAKCYRHLQRRNFAALRMPRCRRGKPILLAVHVVSLVVHKIFSPRGPFIRHFPRCGARLLCGEGLLLSRRACYPLTACAALAHAESPACLACTVLGGQALSVHYAHKWPSLSLLGPAPHPRTSARGFVPARDTRKRGGVVYAICQDTTPPARRLGALAAAAAPCGASARPGCAPRTARGVACGPCPLLWLYDSMPRHAKSIRIPHKHTRLGMYQYIQNAQNEG